MKKLGLGLAALLLFIGIGFIWLISGASPDNAPQEVQTIELEKP
jgi:hypothetical protein